MKITLLILLLLILPGSSAAQEACSLSLNNAPMLFGLKLGMTEEEVRDAIGKELKFKPKRKNTERVFFQNFIETPAPAILPGVRALYLRFFERRLYQIEIFYENQEAGWQTLQNFTDYLSTSINFPAASWTPLKNGAAVQCDGFRLVADKVLNPRVELTAETARTRAEEARKKQSEQ